MSGRREWQRIALLAVGVLLLGTSFALAASPYNAAVMASNPTYYWTFDEEGVVAAQEQVGGLAADVFTPSEASAKTASTANGGGVSLGAALDLNNATASVWNTGDLSGPAFTGAWAYELWINAATPTAYQYILGSNAGNGYNIDSIMQFPFDAGANPEILVYNGGGFGPGPRAPQSSGWHHWVFAFDGSEKYDVYKDGAFVVNAVAGAALGSYPATELRAGGWSAGANGENFTGQIDELAIYDLSGAADLSAAGQAIARHYSVVPEPGSLTLLVLGGLLLALRRRTA